MEDFIQFLLMRDPTVCSVGEEGAPAGGGDPPGGGEPAEPEAGGDLPEVAPGGEVPEGGFGLFGKKAGEEAPAEPPQEGDRGEEAAGAEEEPAEPEEPGEEPPESAWDEIKRRDRELQADRENLLEERATVTAQAQQVQEFQQLLQQAESDPMAVVRALRIDPMRLGDALMGNQPEEQPADPQMDALSQQMATIQQQLQQQQQEQFRSGEVQRITGMLQAAPQSFEVLGALAKENPAILNDVYERGADHYRRTQQVPDHAKIMADMEKELTDNVFASLDVLRTLPSVQERLTALVSDPADRPQTPAKVIDPAPAGQPGTGPQQKTLTGDMEQESLREDRPMDDDEAEAEALKILRNGFRQE